MKIKWILFVAFIVIISMLTGCVDGKQLQQDAKTALQMQGEMKNYRFSGNADLQLDLDESKAADSPLTGGLIAMFTHGKLAWTGTAGTEPVRFEIDVKLNPNGSDKSIDFPLIIKDNKMYFNIPLLNQEDEYFEVDMEQLNKTAQGDKPFSPEGLLQTQRISQVILSHIIDAMNPKWFKEQSAKNGKEKTITVEIQQDNVEEWMNALFDKLPLIVEELQNQGLVSAEKAGQIKKNIVKTKAEQLQKLLKKMQLTKPGRIELTINEQGFVKEQLIQLDYTLTGEDGTASKHRIHLYNAVDEINRNPAFIKEVPDKVRPFEDLLKFINGAAKQRN